MRTKVTIVGLCFVAIVAFAAIAEVPNVVEALRGLAQGESLQEDASSEEGLLPQINATVFLDDFDSSPYWSPYHDSWSGSWEYLINGYVGDPSWEYNQFDPRPFYRDGYCFLNITDDQTKDGWQNRKSKIMDCNVGQEGDGLQIRLRFSDDNGLKSDKGGGRRSWGFYNWAPEREIIFFECNSPGHLYPGLWAVVSWPNIVRKPIEGIDITEWHNYTVLQEPEKATFWVDDVKVATVPTNFSWGLSPRLRMSNVIQEYPYYNATGYVGLAEESYMQVDYVHVFWTKKQVEYLPDLLESASQKIEAAEQTIETAQQTIPSELAPWLDAYLVRMEQYCKQSDWEESHQNYLEVELERLYLDAEDAWSRKEYLEVENRVGSLLYRIACMSYHIDLVNLLSQARQVIGEVEAKFSVLSTTNTTELEVGELFIAAQEAITKAEQMNERPTILAGMKQNYQYATGSFDRGDSQRARVFLESILYTAGQYYAIDTPEPIRLTLLGNILEGMKQKYESAKALALTPSISLRTANAPLHTIIDNAQRYFDVVEPALLPILGLILLPAHLRRR